ncbi:MAG: hypothetical protein HY532_04560 [Chloroflexi bacterium]|nr:hypothetical protein [Chloroflexota bacterium]
MKQYHNRSTSEARLTWDVERLMALAKGLPVKRVPLERIWEFDQVYWFDEEYRPTCRAVVSHMRRIQEVDLAEPIILSADGHVMDGMHRVAKAWLLGHAYILAVQFTEDPEPDRIAP